MTQRIDPKPAERRKPRLETVAGGSEGALVVGALIAFALIAQIVEWFSR